MGAWGLGLFESDHDFDIIDDLNTEAGLDKLQEEAQARVKAAEKLMGTKGGKKDKNFTLPKVEYSIYPAKCSDPHFVREHLKSTGALAKLISTWTAKAPGPRDPQTLHLPGYKLVLIGACAMMMGCTLKEDFIERLRTIFLDVGLMRDALKQVDTALNGPHGFKNGDVYNWGPFGVHEKVKNPELDKIHPGGRLVNVHNPGLSYHAQPDTSALESKIRARMELIKQQKPADVCGGCGATEGPDGGALLICGRCKTRKFCTRVCQQKHWNEHKQLCAKPPGNPSNNEKVKSVESCVGSGRVCLRTTKTDDGKIAIVEVSK